ncbi:FAD/NAD(P)-binding domain-containing protein [Hypoxylon cercidicola]|nr:FAD/NAD(P)-binding domain-containing protein [Hypoxylon cercidicola]
MSLVGMQTDTAPIVDVLIIGGSHAGLSTALTLYRALHTTVIFDSRKPRNSYSTPVRLTSTWEHEQPEKMREASRKELLDAGFTTFVDTEIEKVEKKNDDLFEVTDEKGIKWLGKKVLLATGTSDVFPNILGYGDLYARGIYPCMFQFGFELRGCPSAGLLAVDGLANPLHATILAHDGHKFSDTMTIYTNGNTALGEQISADLKTPGMSVDNREIARVTRGEGSSIVVEFKDGSQKREDFIVHRPLTKLDRKFADQLGLNISKMGDIEAMPPFCKTSVAGVYAAGDCASPMKTISNAMTMGAYAGCGLARELPKVR